MDNRHISAETPLQRAKFAFLPIAHLAIGYSLSCRASRSGAGPRHGGVMKEAEIDPKTLKALIDAFDGSDWEEMTLSLPGGDGLHLSRNPDSTGPTTFGAPPDPTAAAAPSSPTPTP